MTETFIFGVDLDGVCADYTSAFREIVAEVKGVPLESLPLERSWDFSEWGISGDEFMELHHFAVTERRMMATLPTFEDCSDVLWRLSDAGVWIRIITHRLYVNWSHAAAVADTVSWLDTAKIPYRDICFLGAKPQVEADIYIDDAPHNVEGLRSAGNEVVVFDQPYNQDLNGPRAKTWLEVEDIVMSAATQKGAVQPQIPGIDAGSDRLRRNTAN